MKFKNLILKFKELSLAEQIATVAAPIIATGVIAGGVVSYNTYTEYKSNNNTISVVAKDTTAPRAELAQRYIFTNDIASLTDFSPVLESVTDVSDYSIKLIRFQKEDSLYELNDIALRNLLEAMQLPGIEEKLAILGTEDIPSEEGIYRAVLEIADVHGNRSLEELFVIYDTTGARIDDTPDKTVYVAKADLEKEPEIDKTDYSITDNVDGKVKSDDITCELELRDADKHEWLVHVSYTDRAGNESTADFLIIVKKESEKKDTVANKDNQTGEDTSDRGNENKNNAGNQNSADADGDGVVTDEENSKHISPYEQAVIDAGYGVVVQFDDGDYGVLTHGDGCVNGVEGFDILRDYLEELGLEATRMGGCWIDSNNDWYWCIAYDPYPVDNSDNEW